MLLNFTIFCVLQLILAAVISVAFAILQISVMVAVLAQMITYSFCSPTTIMTIIVIGVYFVTALIHPREFTNVLFILIYYLLIPSTLLVLTIYSLCNLNDISWGTREVIQTPAAKEREAERELQVVSVIINYVH